jgi:hypothetical protein
VSEKQEIYHIFSAATARKQAERYDELSFIEKPKSLLFLFYTFLLVFNFLKAGFTSTTDTEYLLRIISIIAYLGLLPFVWFNKQWALIMAATFFIQE